MLPDIQLIVPYEVEGCGNGPGRTRAFSDPGQKLSLSHGSGSAGISLDDPDRIVIFRAKL